MNRQEILEQLRAQSQITYAQAKMDRLHEAKISAYTNTSAAGGSGGGGGITPLLFIEIVPSNDFYYTFSSLFTEIVPNNDIYYTFS